MINFFEDEIQEEEIEIDNVDGEILTVKEAEDIGKRIIGYFATFSDITDYYVARKTEKLGSIKNDLFGGFGQSDELFSDFDLEPKDFDIEITEVETDDENKLWRNLTQITATFPIEDMPGRNVRFIVKEKKSNTVLGMLRLGSPTLNMKPRNSIFGEYLEPQYVNASCVNGTVIVPAQPFGYNLLGGKLMALLCQTNEIRDIINKKYNMQIRLFETTSLYGSIKGVSQYDGLKPYIRYAGDTESNFPMNLSDEVHHELKAIFDKKDPTFSDISTGSVKLKLYMKMIGTIKRILKNEKSPFYEEFLKGLEHSQSLTTKKRYYYSDYGIENIKDVIINNAEPKYKQGMSYERFDLENVVTYWKKMAQKRYEKLKKEGNLRTEVEFWTKQKLLNRSIDIIR